MPKFQPKTNFVSVAPVSEGGVEKHGNLFCQVSPSSFCCLVGGSASV